MDEGTLSSGQVAALANAVLRRGAGANAAFRDGQLEAIERLLRPGARLLLVQKTGWGKSIVYFVTTALLRQAGHGMALIVSPLLALMRNQIDLAEKFGLRAESINSTNRDNWPHLIARVLSEDLDLLLISPERLANRDFRERLLPRLEQDLSLLVIDEAHCISDWGHDFRPDYRRLLSTVARLKPSASILTTTATANNRVIADIQAHLSSQSNLTLEIIRGNLTRENLRLSVFQIPGQAERLAWLAKYLPRLPGTGIVYTLTVNDADRVAMWLKSNGLCAEAYHADLKDETRRELEAAFNTNQIKAIVATTALGMGYDKSDVRFIVHFQTPGSVINYYQQVGRAGRDGKPAYGVLLEGVEDDEIVSWFIEQAFPPAQVFDQVKRAMSEGLCTVDQIATRINYRNAKVEKAIELMDVEGAIRPAEGGGWILVNPDWCYDLERSNQITQQRYLELDQMKDYTQRSGCRMEFLARALDDPNPQKCGKCDNCKPHAQTSVPQDLVQKALNFLRAGTNPIHPRKFFPPGFEAGRKKIPEDRLLFPGVALCVYNDAGWGMLVREGKYETGRFSDELIEPSVERIKKLPHNPEWVTWVPSLDRSLLVPDFARRLAAALNIPAHEAVRKVRKNRPQKEMQTSTNQYRNVWDAFEVPAAVHKGVCLLVDDVIDSGWTMTAIGMKLMDAGATGVIPFALATSKPRGDTS